MSVGTIAIVAFFILHWQLSVFTQSFFHHRYGAHKQFTMSKRAERVFHFLSWLIQGSSYLSPRAYAVLHRMHHAFSDTMKDPHSPVAYPNFFKMMWRTKQIYVDLKSGKMKPEPRFDGDYPSWPLIDDFGSSWPASIAFGAAYTLFYVAFATHWWMFLLVPVHYLMGPIHGAIVNWCGHKYGYRNFKNGDSSKNTLVFDVLTMGELFQNNHHKFGQSPNFAARWFEIDPAYQAIRLFGWLGFIDMSQSQVIKYKAAKAREVASDAAAEAALLPPAFAPSPMDGQ